MKRSFQKKGYLSEKIYVVVLGKIFKSDKHEESITAWYQLDNAPKHWTYELGLFKTFEDWWFGRSGPLSSPPISPDLTPLEFYVRDTIKN